MEPVQLKAGTLDGRLIGYHSLTVFLVETGKGKGSYHTKYRLVGSLEQAVIHYVGLSVHSGHKKRLTMEHARRPVLARCLT